MNINTNCDYNTKRSKDLNNFLPNFLIWDLNGKNDDQEKELNIPQTNLFNVIII